MTTEERNKLAGMKTGARAYPPLVSEPEKLAATLNDIRSFSPKDIADMIAAFGGNQDNVDGMYGGNAASVFHLFINGGTANA